MEYNLELNEAQARLLNREEGDTVTVEVDIHREDCGIGPYEYWGARCFHSDIRTFIESVKFGDIEVPTTHDQDKAIKLQFEQECAEARLAHDMD